MGLGDQPDTGDDRWRCFQCGAVTGMYGHYPEGCPPPKVIVTLSDHEKVLVLRAALQELVDRRERVAAKIGHLTGQNASGTDGRYDRAREALDLTK